MNKSIIIGTLLGDGWIQKYSNRKNSYNFSFSQSKKEYTEWKAKEIGIDFSISEKVRADKRTKKDYYICTAYIKMDKNNKEYFYNLFYTPKKRVTQEILDMVDNLALCVWFLDDGNTYYNGNNCHITISVNGFSVEEKDLIINWFKEKYKLNFKHSSKAIRITSKKECQIFMDIIEKYIPDCMKYKKLSEVLNKYKDNLTPEKLKRRWKINR